jgi:acetylornithine/succinyldiaminopimelate/putrescine aminotransferase
MDWFLFNDRTMRIAPPLVIQENEIRWACQTILEALESV